MRKEFIIQGLLWNSKRNDWNILVKRRAKKCFLRRNEIKFRRSRWLLEVLAHTHKKKKKSTRRSGGGTLMFWRTFLSSGKLKLQFVSGRKKAADYVKMLNDLSLTQDGHRLCGGELIFQQDNGAIHNASITKYLLEQK